MNLSFKLSPVAVGVLFLFSGCAITTRIPADRFDSPETSGKLWAGDAGLGLELGSNEWTVTPDDTANPPNFGGGFERSNPFVSLAGDIGLLDRLDVGLKIRSGSTTLGQAKFQILGEPKSTAKEGNFSLAVSAAVGGASRTDMDTDPFGSVTAHYNISETDFDFAAILGYRVTDSLLFYGGPNWTQRTYNGSISQTPLNSTTQTGLFGFSGNIKQTGFNIGLQTGEKVLFRAEYSGAYSQSFGQNSFGGYFGFDLGFSW